MIKNKNKKIALTLIVLPTSLKSVFHPCQSVAKNLLCFYKFRVSRIKRWGYATSITFQGRISGSRNVILVVIPTVYDIVVRDKVRLS